MPISGQGWELLAERFAEQSRANAGFSRTVSRYQVFHDGVAMPGLSGFFAERQGPGDNTSSGVANSRRIAEGAYKLATHDGASNDKYKTIGYSPSDAISELPRPSIRLLGTGARSGILFHPGSGWLWSIGCFNPGFDLASASANLGWKDSRLRVIALIDDMKAFLGNAFPTANNKTIPGAVMVVDGDP